jgi:arylsulfatase A-like enzyme
VQSDRSGRIEDTILVVVADHGEYLGEHGLLKHMYFHFEEALHVPMIVAGPGVPEGEVRTDPVSLVDIFDTVCDLAGVDPPAATSSHSIFGDDRRDAVFMENGIRPVSESYTDHLSPERLDEFERGRKSIRTGKYLFTLDSAGEERLYERPGDRRVDDSAEEAAATLRERLLDTLGEDFGQAEGYGDDLDSSVEANLRELGYID